jgi:hypothetical protein
MSHCIHLTAVDSREFNFKYYYSTLGTELHGPPWISFLTRVTYKNSKCWSEILLSLSETAVRNVTLKEATAFEMFDKLYNSNGNGTVRLDETFFHLVADRRLRRISNGAVRGMWGTNAIKSFKSINDTLE